ncbi:MAG: hypothetical protein BZ138_02805 [Methanosphaera sp. rholeuAM270]|nr:MAG: hypothetical protein BZ138_02805 [Methanosphaera sp. rholeuAM270]
MNSKGIINIEILISLMLFIMICLLLSSLAMQEYTSIDETQNRKESRIIVSDISDIINRVYQNGDGYSITYKLPPKINKETYVLKINDTGVYINSHYQLSYSKIFVSNILKQKQYYLAPGNVYEFINNNNSIEIIQNT